MTLKSVGDHQGGDEHGDATEAEGDVLQNPGVAGGVLHLLIHELLIR